MPLINLTAEQRKEARIKAQASRSLRKSPEKLLETHCPHIQGKRYERILQRLENFPESHRMKLIRAVKGTSKKNAILANCVECIGFENAKEGILNCTSLACPMYPYRPYRQGE